VLHATEVVADPQTIDFNLSFRQFALERSNLCGNFLPVRLPLRNALF
jgi:hypothetical protein